MRSTRQRVSFGVWLVCGLVSIAVVIIGVLGVVGVRSAKNLGNAINHDQVVSASLAGNMARTMGAVHLASQALMLSTSPQEQKRLVATLSGDLIPSMEARINDEDHQHADHPGDAQEMTALRKQWAVTRNLVAEAGSQPSAADAAMMARLNAAFDALSGDMSKLTAHDEQQASARQASTDTASNRTMQALAVTVGLAILGAMACAWIGNRRLRMALEPAVDQVMFADTMQMAQDEVEAHVILKRHLERNTPRSTVTVLNRNNSADRLEAVTPIPVDSPLEQSLEGAQPNSCLAVRSGRRHDENDRRPPLLGCSVCGPCTGRSSCHPLTVGGQVIGAVLVNGAKPMDLSQRQRVRDSVGQAAPVLANLRNLAIAELRAATDALTALPNKRTVTDTLMRMLAQASRTLTPLCLLMLDLDHFKNVNDKFGHPVGDQALASVGAVLRSALRAGDFAGRNGGEEFAVMLPDTDLAGARVTAEKICAAVAEIRLPGVDLVLTVSIGIAAFPEHALSTERLERLADSALYVAKRSGRNRVEVATPRPEPVTGADDETAVST